MDGRLRHPNTGGEDRSRFRPQPLTYESGRTAASTGASGPVVPETRQGEASGFRCKRPRPTHHTMQRILVIPLHAQRQKFRQSEASGVSPPPPQTGAGLCSTSPLGSNMVRVALLTEPQHAPPKTPWCRDVPQ
ncbi:hypothetical protein TcYC6_0022280 [Trypanosoma cruzi]|nr:hypothetical protein TcYC6_0022280 [Trypanosoma cruzi]